jgi:hypothetical protein
MAGRVDTTTIRCEFAPIPEQKRTAKVRDFNSWQVDLAKSTFFFLICDVHVHRVLHVTDDIQGV